MEAKLGREPRMGTRGQGRADGQLMRARGASIKVHELLPICLNIHTSGTLAAAHFKLRFWVEPITILPIFSSSQLMGGPYGGTWVILDATGMILG